jgi:urease accessory protein
MLLVVTPMQAPEAIADALRRGLAPGPAIYAGASALPSACGAAARLLAPDGGTLKTAVTAAWAAVREALTGCAPGVRRK